MISSNASNRVERAEPAGPKIAKALRHFLGFAAGGDDAERLERARVLVSMVAADASEVQVAAYLGYLEDQQGRPPSSATHRRLEAIAIRHIAKAAPTRDRALRLLGAHPPEGTVDHERLSVWLAERIGGDGEERWERRSDFRTRPLDHGSFASSRESQVPREIDDGEGVRWTCAQAYAGLTETVVDPAAAKVDGADRYRVICTPSGGSKSVELELPGGWEEELSDEALLREIHRNQ